MPTHLVEHPLISERLTRLRMTSTQRPEFRRALTELSTFVIYEALRNLETTPIEIDTPLERTTGAEITTSPIVVPVMRAGLGMLDAALELLPDSVVGFIGLKRDEETLLPQTYANTLPDDLGRRPALVLDPMLATGGSLVHTCELLQAANAGKITVACVLSSAEGVQVIAKAFPDIDTYTASIDPALNNVGFIQPGLGDAGDRQFGLS